MLNNKKENKRLPMPGKVKKGFRCYCTLVMAAALLGCCSMTAFAADDPLEVVNNLSEFIFGLIRAVGLILLAMFVAYIVCNVLAMKNTPAPEEEEQAEEGSFAKELGLLAIGAVLIAVGADLLVDNGTLIAQALGVPESVIALTFVALGTSLPELVTAITSLAKGHGALSLGNVIGANVFNLVLVSGVSVTLAPFSIPQNSTIAGMNASLVMDIPVMFTVMLLLTVPALIKGKLSRPQGIALLCIYAAFCAVQFSI